jgi:hypothetical protein
VRAGSEPGPEVTLHVDALGAAVWSGHLLRIGEQGLPQCSVTTGGKGRTGRQAMYQRIRPVPATTVPAALPPGGSEPQPRMRA